MYDVGLCTMYVCIILGLSIQLNKTRSNFLRICLTQQNFFDRSSGKELRLREKRLFSEFNRCYSIPLTQCLFVWPQPLVWSRVQPQKVPCRSKRSKVASQFEVRGDLNVWVGPASPEILRSSGDTSWIGCSNKIEVFNVQFFLNSIL